MIIEGIMMYYIGGYSDGYSVFICENVGEIVVYMVDLMLIYVYCNLLWVLVYDDYLMIFIL